jgi:AcrR family transcriptional regulator
MTSPKSPSLARREQERADTRRKILNAAREMFVHHGYEATTMRAIADRIQYTPTAIYHHFQNKEALLTELTTQDFRALAEAFQKIGKIADPVERLHRIGEAYVEFGLTHPMQYRLMFMTPSPVGGTTKEIAHGDPGEDAYAFLKASCAEAIETGRFLAEFGDAEQVAQILWAGCHGLVSLHIAKAHDHWVDWRDLQTTSARLRDAMMNGMLRR